MIRRLFAETARRIRSGGLRWLTLTLVPLYLLTVGQWLGALFLGWPSVRFASAVLNVAIMAGVLLIPFVLTPLTPRLTNKAFRRVSQFTLVPLVLVSWFAIPLGFLALEGFEPMGAVEHGRYRVSAYRVNGGATTGFGVRLRESRRVVAGVVVVRDLKHWPGDTVDLALVGAGRVRVRVGQRQGARREEIVLFGTEGNR